MNKFLTSCVVVGMVGLMAFGGAFICKPDSFQAAFSDKPVARKCPQCGEGLNLFTLTDEWVCNTCDLDHMKALMESHVREKQLVTPRP